MLGLLGVATTRTSRAWVGSKTDVAATVLLICSYGHRDHKWSRKLTFVNDGGPGLLDKCVNDLMPPQ